MDPPRGARVDLPAPPPNHSGRRRLWPFVAAGLAVAAVVVAVLALTGVFSSNDQSSAKKVATLSGPKAAPFRIAFPRSWRPLNAAQLAQLPGRPLAVLRRSDGHGTLVINARPPVRMPLDRLAASLKRGLARQFKDFREVGAKLVSLRGTRALVYTFARTRTGTAQSLVVVPAGDHSFTLDAVIPPKSPEAAHEVGAIIASFAPQGER